MRSKIVYFVSILIMLAAAACDPPVDDPTEATNRPSAAFFDVPDSLAADHTARAVRTTNSDAWVVSSVETYYEYVRGQVRFGAAVADGVRGILEDLEAVVYGEGFLLDQTVNLNVTTANAKYTWTTVAASHFRLEWWNLSNAKLMELDFYNTDGHYMGTARVSGAAVNWGFPVSWNTPDMLFVGFDSNSDGAGTAELELWVEDFRVHPDLCDGDAYGEEDMVICMTRSASGQVSLGSVARVANSRHFVWNGYYYSGEVNTFATPEVRYYTAAGIGSTADLATVYLGIPKTTVGTDVFTANGIGNLIATQFTERLNNNYDFGNQENDRAFDIMALGNLVATTDLACAAVPESNTTEQVNAWLDEVKAYLDQPGDPAPNDWIDYLDAMMAVGNPAYFSASSYTGYGATAPGAGYPALTESEARALLPGSGAVDALADGSGAIEFQGSATPGF